MPAKKERSERSTHELGRRAARKVTGTQDGPKPYPASVKDDTGVRTTEHARRNRKRTHARQQRTERRSVSWAARHGFSSSISPAKSAVCVKQPTPRARSMSQPGSRPPGKREQSVRIPDQSKGHKATAKGHKQEQLHAKHTRAGHAPPSALCTRSSRSRRATVRCHKTREQG